MNLYTASIRQLQQQQQQQQQQQLNSTILGVGHALPNAERRAVLRAVVEVEQPSLAAAATLAGIACFVARENDFERSLVADLVERAKAGENVSYAIVKHSGWSAKC